MSDISTRTATCSWWTGPRTIIRGGENIYPKEIETVVYGVEGRRGGGDRRPDESHGEVPVLYAPPILASGIGP